MKLILGKGKRMRLNLNKRVRNLILLILVLILFGFLYSLNFVERSFWTENEAFYALGARSVLGGNILLPKIYNNVYSNKPPLFFWLIAGVSSLFGGVTEWTVRLANIISSLAVLLGLLVFARRWVNQWSGLLAVIILGTTYEFFQQSSQASTDTTLTALAVFSWTAMFGILTDRFTWSRWLVLWGCIGLGMLTKGPVILVLTGLILLAFSFCQFGWREGWKRIFSLKPLLGISSSIMVFCTWCISVFLLFGPEVLNTVIIKHNLIRFLNAFDHAKPLWYYIHELPINMLPWSLLLPWTFWYLLKNWRDFPENNRHVLTFSLIIIGVIFLFFSASSSKQDYYLLPLMPWFSLVVAEVFWHCLCKTQDQKYLMEDCDAWTFVSRLWQWKMGRIVSVSMAVLLIVYGVYAGIVTELLEKRKSPKHFAQVLDQSVDEDDQLIFIDEEDPRFFYYLNEPFQTVSTEETQDIKRLRSLLLTGTEVDIVVEDKDLNTVAEIADVSLYIEQVVTFRDDTFYILTNERKPGLEILKNG